MAAATLVVVASLAAVIVPRFGNGSAAPQIPGSPAAPTAAEVSPICSTTIPAKVLGPASAALPASPVSTVVTPSGGVANFAATSSALYVNNGTQLVTYSLSGAQESAFNLPSLFTKSYAGTPVIDP